MDERVTVEVRRSVLGAVEDLARREGVPVERFIARVLAETMGAGTAAEVLAGRGQGADAARAVAWLEARAV